MEFLLLFLLSLVNSNSFAICLLLLVLWIYVGVLFLLSATSWYAIMFLLLMSSGVLSLLLYICCFNSNQKVFSIKMSTFMKFSVLILFLILMKYYKSGHYHLFEVNFKHSGEFLGKDIILWLICLGYLVFFTLWTTYCFLSMKKKKALMFHDLGLFKVKLVFSTWKLFKVF